MYFDRSEQFDERVFYTRFVVQILLSILPINPVLKIILILLSDVVDSGMYQIRSMIDTPHSNPTIADYITSAYSNDLTENDKYQTYDKTNDTIGYYIVLYILFMNKGIVRPIHLKILTILLIYRTVGVFYYLYRYTQGVKHPREKLLYTVDVYKEFLLLFYLGYGTKHFYLFGIVIILKWLLDYIYHYRRLLIMEYIRELKQTIRSM